MSASREQRAKEIQAAIRDVLVRDWDPARAAEAGLRDEYDSYIGRIYRLLVSEPKREEVARELKKIEAECMSYEVSEESLLPVADKLLSIAVELFP